MIRASDETSETATTTQQIANLLAC